MTNKFNVFRCSEILQKFNVDLAMNELPELSILTETLEKLDQKYQNKSKELAETKQYQEKLIQDLDEMRLIFQNQDSRASKGQEALDSIEMEKKELNEQLN